MASVKLALVPAVQTTTNELLGNLPERELALLAPGMRTLTLKLGQLLFDYDEPPTIVYFPLTAIVSMLALMRSGHEIEYGSIGREGMIGLQVPLDAQPLRGRAICQLAGDVVAIDAAHIRSLDAATAPVLRRLLLRYAQSTINVLAQSTACNALHSVRERVARWLLMTRYRAGSDAFALTQEFLSKMLGVRRAGVTEVAGDLHREGIIDYTRGHMRILDAERLEGAACECYDIIRDEYRLVTRGA